MTVDGAPSGGWVARSGLVVALLLAVPGAVPAAIGEAGEEARQESAAASPTELERALSRIMAKAGIPALSFARLDEGRAVRVRAFGVRSADSDEPVDADTVFAAASFSKPVFAWLAMLLAEEGALELDRPLEEYLDSPLGELPRYADLEGDLRTANLTARHVLSHTTGFPNWRFLTDDGRLRLISDPGRRFGYSGEGIALLQMVVERITGRGLEELAREKVFDPLRMTRTSYVWQEAFEANHALPHDEFERPKKMNRRHKADAAGSMLTTAGDYAKFVVALLGAEGPRRLAFEAMLKRQVGIDSERMFGPRSWERTAANRPISLGWGLGWGRFDTERERAFFHTGHDSGWQNYTVTYADTGSGVIFLSNSDNFESVARELVAAVLPEDRSPFDWLGYPVFDPSRRREPPPEPVEIELAEAVLERYAGEFQFFGDRALAVELRDGALWISEGDDEPGRLRAESETDFFVTGEDTRFRFVVSEGGEVERLLILLEDLEIVAMPIAGSSAGPPPGAGEGSSTP